MKTGLIGLAFLLSFFAQAAEEQMSVVEVKEAKRFGIGVTAGGPLAVLGLETDINLSEIASVSLGIGTGLDYSTLAVKGRFFLPGRWVSPYLGFGMARWWTGETKNTKLAPSVLPNRFLRDQTASNGFDVFIFYPAAGVQFMHSSGVAFSLELEYLFRLFSFASGTYAGLGVHWYF